MKLKKYNNKDFIGKSFFNINTVFYQISYKIFLNQKQLKNRCSPNQVNNKISLLQIFVILF